MGDRELDVVLFGGTGFVGRLVAQHLAASVADADTGIRVGLAGRSAGKLAALARDLGVDWPASVVDAHDEGAVAALAKSARVVATTVGPYGPRGLPLLRACAAAGTSYADLTGEAGFVRAAIDQAHATAERSGARIVPACGFDAVPSDLGVQALADRVIADGEGELAEATLLVVSVKGGLSGGTIDSMRVQIDDARADPAAARALGDPYLLSPDSAAEPDLGRQPDAFLAERLPDGTWVAPSVMASFNTRVVRRSNALQGHRYGRRLRYREVVRTGRSPLAPVAAAGIALGAGALMRGMRTPVIRPVLDRVLPAPGEGPSEQVRSTGRFRFEIRGVSTTGARYTAVVAADGDPGYAATSVMFGQAALCLAADDLDSPGGVLTPASAMDGALARRLRSHGFTLEVHRD